MMYKAGIIGCGRIGVEFEDCHAKAYMECPDTELIMLADVDLIKQKKWSRRYGVLPLSAPNGDYMRGIEVLGIDMVSVCTPPETHCQIVCDIAPYVKAIYCEKPIALTLEDADKMIETCHKHNAILQVNHQRCFTWPQFRFSRGIINTGTHMFSLLTELFGECIMVGDIGAFKRGDKVTMVEVEYVYTDEPIFELDCTHNKEKMINKGVQYLVDCLKTKQALGNKYPEHLRRATGEKAREALMLALKYQELVEKI